MSQIRLLAVIEAYSITGPAKNLIEFARLAKTAGVETTIATFTRGDSSNHFIETARGHGIPVEAIRERSAYDPRAMRALLQVAESLRPQVIQTHAVKSHFLARKTGLRSLAPWVAFHHGYTWTSRRTRLYNQLDRWSLRAADRVLTVSVPFRDELVQIGVSRDRIEIIHNAIPRDWEAESRTTERASALRAGLGIPERLPVILIVGRLSAEKDHITLLEAAARLQSKFAPHLVIVGEGPDRNRIEERIAQLDLTGHVTLTGHQKSAGAYYGIADVAVLSSRSEGSPNALLEAMAAHVPVVATRVGGIPEIVTHGESALLVDPGDVTQVSDAIARILSDPAGLAKQLAGNGYALVQTRHEPRKRVQRLIRIYESMLRTRVTA